MDTVDTATMTLLGSSQQAPPQQSTAATIAATNTNSSNHHQRESNTDVMVTPASSRSLRKRSFPESNESQLNDPSFRFSCKKRFLQMKQSTIEEFMNSPHRNIDVLRDVVHDELRKYRGDMLKCRGVNQPLRHDQANTVTVDSMRHEEVKLDVNGNTVMADYSQEQTGPQSRQRHPLPRASHFIDDNELYELLLEMEHEISDTFQSNGKQSTSQYLRTELPVAQDTSVAVMTDWEEEMYYMSTCHTDDAVQEQIMDYYNHE